MQDITGRVCLGDREGWKTVKKADVCRFPPERLALEARASAYLHVQLPGDVLFVFLVKVKRFNGERAAPDVSQEDHSHSYSVTSRPTETGFR